MRGLRRQYRVSVVLRWETSEEGLRSMKEPESGR